MAKRPTLSDINNIYTATTTLNSNNDAVEAAFDNTLSRDGSTPNQMEADLDLNSNDILNVGEINADRLTLAGATLTSTVTVPNWKSSWTTATSYILNDIVREAGSTYICIEAHTSGTFSTDLTMAKWELFAQQGSAGAGTGDMLAANDLSDVSSVPNSRANLGLGTAAITDSADYATAAQGSTADTALQPAVIVDEDDMVSDSATLVPTQQSVKAYVDTEVAAVGYTAPATAGDVGTYVFARRTSGTTDVAFGSTLAGSSLSPTSAFSVQAGSDVSTYTMLTGSALSGTWQAMGYYDFDVGSVYRGATLWLRTV